MKSASLVLIIPIGATLLLTSRHADAAGTAYTVQSNFTSALDPGAYTENFSSFSNYGPGQNSANFTNGTYTAVATTVDIFNSPMVLYTQTLSGNAYLTVGGGSTFTKSITITFTSGNINAIGGSFFYTGGSGNIVNAPLTLTFSDGTTEVLNGQTNSSFFGYISTTPLTSLTITSDATHHFGSIDNLIIGSAPIPEPSAGALLGAGALTLAMARRRVRKG